MDQTFTKAGFDLGIVTTNDQAMLEFYRDVVGLRFEATLTFDNPLITTMHRLWANDSLLKLVVPRGEVASPVPDGIGGATGMRYFTLSVDNIDELTKRCEDAGAKVVWPVHEVRPGVTVSMLEDPDGNWVELLVMS